MNIVIVGHVDHGKSTIIGRMLADTGTLPQGKLEQIKENCRINSKPFEFAFLLDALKDEQAQGITIDAARVFFKTKKRDYIIIDAPGHIEFLKNMITGASSAETALLVIDANEGVQENSRRHGYMLSLLGIKQVVVLINKMDLVNYDEKIFRNITSEYSQFLSDINLSPKAFLPVSGMKGDNITTKSPNLSWFNGNTVLEILDQFETEPDKTSKPFRMPVQDVYKFTKLNDSRRIIAGTIETGKINEGDKITFYPSGKNSIVKTIEGFNQPHRESVEAGFATGFTIKEQVYVKRGEIAVRSDEQPPCVSTRIKVSIFWLGKKPMVSKEKYILKIGTAKVFTKLEKVIRVIDSSNLETLENKNSINRNQVAECILKTDKQIAFDIADTISATSRFVLVDDYEIRGGGIIIENLQDNQSELRNKVFLRNTKWIKGDIPFLQRAERYSQRATLLLVTGKQNSFRKEVAKNLESKLFQEGRIVYYLGFGSLLYGMDADLKSNEHKIEHIRRMAEIAHIILDSGMILVLSIRELTQNELEIVKTSVDDELIETIWVGDDISTNINYDLHIESHTSLSESYNKIKDYLQSKGIIMKVW